jgi:hypothetical protein
MNPCVVDASVVTAAFFQEDHAEAARADTSWCCHTNLPILPKILRQHQDDIRKNARGI